MNTEQTAGTMPPNLAAELDHIAAGASDDYNAPPPPPTGADRWAALVVELGMPAFAAIAPAWNVQRHELVELGAGIAPALQKYLPMDDDFTLPPEIVALAAVFVFASRHAGQPRKIQPVQAEQEAAP